MEMYRMQVLVCAGGACLSSGSASVYQVFEEELTQRGLSKEIRLIQTGCVGTCDIGPVVVVYPEGVFYQKITPQDVSLIVDEHFIKGRPVRKLLYQEKGSQKIAETYKDIAYFQRQIKVVLRNSGIINPESIDEYIARDGYQALAKVLTEMTPEQVVETVKKSGLRGRGGGGFITGIKWDLARQSPTGKKYVLCNADEGDPGAFMDRSVLEGDPHSVIEAMAIAGRTIGSDQGFVYVRAEYPLAIERLSKAIMQAREYGLLGKTILDTDFSFDLDIRVGAGAFVCGEETALIHSVEGKRGMPRPRPPYPAVKGLFDCPTLLNNVETYANIPPIILNGGEWFAQWGTEGSKGTKVFALAGAINNTGLIEVPMGIPMGEIIYDIGGGVPKGKEFKAVQAGGPSGGCIPKEYLNTPVDYESLKKLGAIVGSGGLIIMDEDTCMVDLARFFMDFIVEESCGKCTPCRVGTKRMLQILNRITRGEGKMEDIDLLINLGEQITKTALCGLGQTAANPVLSTLRYFRHEYEEHIKYKKCSAGVCSSLFQSPCQNACPVGINVPGYVALIGEGRFKDALQLIRERNPLPGICGRVCHHPCQSKCRRGQTDESIAIKWLKRFAADWEIQNQPHIQIPISKQERPERVAIVGAGPTGLTAAYDLALDGYRVTVYDAMPKAGGMLAWGIPNYRLPAEILDYETRYIQHMGVEFRFNTRIGKDISLDQLKKDNQALLLAVGAQAGLKLSVPGEDLPGVMGGIDFLREVNLNNPVSVGQQVAVVGGGNAAIDSARTALRMGAKKVTVIYRRQKELMPADPEELHQAEQEGVEFIFLANPIKILGNGRVEAIECIRMTLNEFDKSGRRKPVPAAGSEFVIPVDMVIPAISQSVDSDFIPENNGIRLTRWNTIAVDPDTLYTGSQGVFAGGDAVSGPKTVIEAIKAGHTAARYIKQFLNGRAVSFQYEALPETEIGIPIPPEDEEIIEKPQRIMPDLPVRDRLNPKFPEVESGYTVELAMEEAKRCLRCDRQA
ncbi:MAG: NADH-quinone oxidoreductase subunit NuoF [Candidatus Delongbacteria bacterium]|nr:NADH-quinone oxidoreductase subunit NuoF [Candidatus Delongbacteria bacterium]